MSTIPPPRRFSELYFETNAWAILVGGAICRGHEYVKFVGFLEFDVADYGSVRSPWEVIEEKYSRVENYGKPVVLIELGVAGGGEFDQLWLEELRDRLPAFPLLRAVIYFYAKDPARVWGEEFSTPDWRIAPELLET